MREGWRWFGPQAGVSLDEVRQAGATDVVSALHQIPIGEPWTDAAVAERKNLIETTPHGRVPLRWSVVESIPIPDRVKREGKQARGEIESWIASLEAVARARRSLCCSRCTAPRPGRCPVETRVLMPCGIRRFGYKEVNILFAFLLN